MQALQLFHRIMGCAGLCQIVQIYMREEEELISSWPQILLTAEALRLRMSQRFLMSKEIFLEMPCVKELSSEGLGIDLKVQGELEFRGE